MGEVEVKWRDRDVAVADGLEVGIGAAGPGGASAADPEDGATPGVFHRLQRVRVDPAPELREASPADAARGYWRQVDVQQRIARQRGQRRDVRQQRREHADLLLEVREVRPEVAAGE